MLVSKRELLLKPIRFLWWKLHADVFDVCFVIDRQRESSVTMTMLSLAILICLSLPTTILTTERKLWSTYIVCLRGRCPLGKRWCRVSDLAIFDSTASWYRFDLTTLLPWVWTKSDLEMNAADRQNVSNGSSLECSQWLIVRVLAMAHH